jgi:5-carboxymethyl-2-hydroxymuconate isomerase
MPHLTLEYSDNLLQFDASKTLLDLNETLVASGHFDEIDIKSRAVCFSTFLVGTVPEGRGFVHVKLALLSGRSIDTKHALAERLMRVLEQVRELAAGVHVQFCVEIQDIERESYVKASIAP